MKRLILFLALVAIGGIAWATPDYVQSTEYSGSQQIKSSPGIVYSVSASYIGATAGDYIQLKDGTGTTASQGTIRFTCVASASSGTCIGRPIPAYYFSTGIWYQESKSGEFKTDIQSF